MNKSASFPAPTTTFSPSSIPLSPLSYPSPLMEGELLVVYKTQLDEVHKGLFRHLWEYVWRKAIPAPNYTTDLAALSYFFLLPVVMDHFQLYQCELSLWSRLWILSGGGKIPIPMAEHDWSRHDYVILRKFTNKGYLIRTNYDPRKPHSTRFQRHRFIIFNREGREFYLGVQNYMRRQIIQWHYNDAIGSNRKAPL